MTASTLARKLAPIDAADRGRGDGTMATKTETTRAMADAAPALLAALKAASESLRCLVTWSEDARPGCACWGCGTMRSSAAAIAAAEGK